MLRICSFKGRLSLNEIFYKVLYHDGTFLYPDGVGALSLGNMKVCQVKINKGIEKYVVNIYMVYARRVLCRWIFLL
jgi:hypothetical protein